MTTAKTALFKITVDHPRLRDTDAESFSTFMRKYEQYCNELTSGNHQLSYNSLNTEPFRPVELNLCVDVDVLKSTIALGFY